jgi:signal recognition particle receptor subunit beta
VNRCLHRTSKSSPHTSHLKASNCAMAIINQATKELQVKIVFYGPAMGGKTTNLIKVHENIQTAKEKGKLVSLATSSDRTLFFDFLPIEAVAIKGFRTKFQLYTVPGQVIYNTTRQLVLRGVDGIVFVADSQYDKMAENVESFSNLEENLRTLKLNLAEIPYGTFPMSPRSNTWSSCSTTAKSRSRPSPRWQASARAFLNRST